MEEENELVAMRIYETTINMQDIGKALFLGVNPGTNSENNRTIIYKDKKGKILGCKFGGNPSGEYSDYNLLEGKLNIRSGTEYYPPANHLSYLEGLAKKAGL